MFIVWGIGGSFVDYSTRYKLNPLGQLDIIFELPLRKRFLALIPPSLADIKAEIRYRLEGENRWQGPIIATPVNNIGMKTLTVWKQDAKNRLFQVDEVSTPLPPTFILSVRLLRQADGKCIADFEIEYAQPPNSPN